MHEKEMAKSFIAEHSSRKVFVVDPEETKEATKKCEVTFVLAFATPGAGKSFALNKIKSKLPSEYKHLCVSQDEIRGAQM